MGAFTIFTAFRSNAGQTLLYERGPDVNGNDGEYLATSTGSSIAVRRSPSTNTQKEFAGNWASSATILTSAHTYNGTHAGHLLYVNGNGVTLSNAGALTGNPGVTPVSGALHIGARLSNLVPLAGHVSEMLIYDSALNQAAIRIVNNYLSAKYNAAMAVPLTNDRYNYDATGIDYDFDVFGIGAEADGTQTTGSFGTGLTLTEANSSLTAGEYLLAGRTLTAPNGTVTTDLVGTGVAERLGRIWALDKTGSLDATLTFSLDELALNPFDGNYALLYRSGLTGDFTNLGLLGSELGFDISFTVPNLQLQDGYYTLGIVLPAPEPSSIVLLGCGALGLAMRGRRRREQQLVSNA